MLKEYSIAAFLYYINRDPKLIIEDVPVLKGFKGIENRPTT